MQDRSHEGTNIPLGIPNLFFLAETIARLTIEEKSSQISHRRESAAADIKAVESYKLIDRTVTTMRLDTFAFPQSRESTTNDVVEEQFRKKIILYLQRHKISERFDVLAQREDNWDGYDSKKPTELTLARAKLLIEGILEAIVVAGYPWVVPFISSDEDGNVIVEWYEGERELHLQIGENVAEYLQVWGTNIDTEMREDSLRRDDYLTLWGWLLDG